MKTKGIMTPGHYVLNDQTIVYCDMTKPISDDSIQSHVGRLSYTDVMFVASKRSGGFISTGHITFETESIDNSNSFDHQRGEFVAPKTGSYIFQFECRTQGPTSRID